MKTRSDLRKLGLNDPIVHTGLRAWMDCRTTMEEALIQIVFAQHERISKLENLHLREMRLSRKPMVLEEKP